VSGANIAYVKAIAFASKKGVVASTVVHTTNTTAEAPVPAGAIDGPVIVGDAYGNVSPPSKATLDITPRSALQSSGALEIREAQVTPSSAYYFGTAKPTLQFVIAAPTAQNLRVDVVSDSGEVVNSFPLANVAPNVAATVTWDGSDSSGNAAPSGHYSFRIGPASGGAAGASQVAAGDTGVNLYGYIFPVRGKHDFGGPGDRFGAPRSGHTHQGQDILSACGTKLVAARGGKVQYNGYEGSAGNYLVIDEKGSGEDNAYMHLAQPSPLKTGSTVRTGQPIGVVGDTGDATACHLHFERWSPPGWYEGGSPFDPLPGLKQWDAYS